MVYPAEAIYVFHIFERFAAGDSLGKISTSLAQMNVLSPTGKDIWSKETISKILNNDCDIIGLNQQALVPQAVALI